MKMRVAAYKATSRTRFPLRMHSFQMLVLRTHYGLGAVLGAQETKVIRHGL